MMNLTCSKAVICTDPNRHTRFIPETESPEPFAKGFTGLPGAFSARSREIFWENPLPKEGGVQFLSSC
jgi:hypothetical protein